MEESTIIYITSWYNDKNPERAKELEECFIRCVNSSEIDDLIVIHEKGAVLPITEKSYIAHELDHRPTYNDFFKVANHYTDPGNVVIIANTDLYPEGPIRRQLRSMKMGEAYALSRWDIVNNGVVHFNRRDSQDVWIFRTPILKQLDAPFCLGKPGCDNRIAQLIIDAGYRLTNPSKSIKFYHLHKSQIRNYTSAETIPGPYHFINPSGII